MFDLAAIGESLIDFTPAGKNELGMQLFSRNPGGAPANVLAMFARLGGETAFIGKVGNDEFGRFLTETMQDAGIDTHGVRIDDVVPTTLAFVQLNEAGDRSFSFYRKPGADIRLRAEEIASDIVHGSRVLHFGSVSLTDEPCRTAVLTAVAEAKRAGALISYDPNYRPLLWSSEKAAAHEMRGALALADIVKVSEEEMVLLTGETDLFRGAQALCLAGPAAVLVTRGPEGAFFYTAAAHGAVRTYAVRTVDTTGAGDAFFGALLWRLRECSMQQLAQRTASEWQQDTAFANAAGSLTTLGRGAIPAMPDLSAIEACMRTVPLL